MGRLFICVTCDRYAASPIAAMTPGEHLAQSVKAAANADGAAIAVRMVECLNTCPNPCAAALREPGKAVIRFGGLDAEDTTALVEAAALYAASADGDVPTGDLPKRLRDKIAGRVTLGLSDMAGR